MKKQIVHISVHQTSKVISAMHTAMLTILFVLPTVAGYWYHQQFAVGLFFLILIPLLTWLFMYIGYVFACWFYNLVVPWAGGIEIEVVDVNKFSRLKELNGEFETDVKGTTNDKIPPTTIA